ncbi:thioesterase II family protein [Streptomyces sp. NPDC059255]|uniref:thioesterase II family protein n=1 Tax=Streptomyces sp. NPDC059255 TaxID=3346793 RepID=UPI0036C4A3AE
MHRRTSPWLLRRKQQAAAGLRLYCFPHSGASAGEYMRWTGQLPGVEVIGVQAPGRGSRPDEAPHTAMDELVDALVSEAEFDAPFAFFGHSLGALTAYEATKALRERGRTQPVALFVSAMGAPHLQPHEPPTHHLDDELFLRTVEAAGPLPAVVREDPELRDMVLRSLRGDARVLDTYHHTPGLPLDLPVIALGGAEDPETGLLPPWTQYSTCPPRTHVLPGDHFYLREQSEELLGIILDTVRHLGAGTEPVQ